MASNKKLRKQNKHNRLNGRPQTGEYRHPDGDRRHRGGPNAKQAIADKRARLEFGSFPPLPDDPDEPATYDL